MSQTEQILDKYGNPRGWCVIEKLGLALDYIQSQGSPEAWEDFVAAEAADYAVLPGKKDATSE